jgi:hypothetical protein
MAFIEIPVSNSILTTYNTDVNTGLFKNRGTDLDPEWFFHLPFSNDTPRDPTKETIIHKSVNGSYKEMIPKLPFIQIETRDSRTAIQDVLTEIEEESEDGSFMVYDWANPLLKDRKLGFDYTIRQMILKTPVQALGTLFKTQAKGLLNAMGWRVQLEALDYDS